MSYAIGATQGTWTVMKLLRRSPTNGAPRLLIRCRCGKEKEIWSGNWRRGAGTKTCACIPKGPNYNQLPRGEASFNFLFDSYRRKATQRGLSFDLTRDEFRALSTSDCAYCGLPPSQIRKTTSGTPYVYSGVDRVDPSKGYTNDNVAPCCRLCNVAKYDLTLDEWREHIQLLWERLCQP